ncbi:hypothetical protein NM22_09990 [Vibrio tubiashii]|nr:hypothetical protein NM22_09990 [Vibrio tubiashii]
MNDVSRSKKIFERVVLIGAVIAAICAVLMANSLYSIYLEKTYPKSELYGTWVEQNVASYAADEFVLSPSGVSIDGGVVDTKYRWNGVHLEYRLGDKERKFKALNEQFTELQLISEPSYQPIYRLSNK